jgi:nucleoside-diphosphate-sugar epimerase
VSKQSVLVLGADDAIGLAVIAALADSDWATPVVLASEYSSGAAHAERIASNERGTTALSTALTTADAVVAAFSGSPKLIRSQAAALFAAGPTPWQHKRIVHLSSMTVYGAASGNVDETTDIGNQLSPYALSRLESEQLARAYSNVITLRPGVEYGPHCGAWSERIARWLLAGRIGDLGALGDGYCNLVFIEDLAAAIVKALRLPEHANQLFNLAAPAPPTWNEYFLSYGKALGAVPIKRITRRRLRIETKLFAPPLKIVELAGRSIGAQWLAGMPAIPPSVLGVFAQEIALDASRATAALELHWTPLTEGLKRTARWFQER